MKTDKPRIDTLCAHSASAAITNESVALPIYQTSTFRFPSVESLEKYLEDPGDQYSYTRYENPTLRAVQEKIAALEKGEDCFIFTSGMAAITSSILAFVKEGDHVLASDSLYGRTQLFMENWLPRFGIQRTFAPCREFPEIERHITPQTRIVYIETPTNPTLQVIDIRATAEIAHKHGALLFIDNTFANPVNQTPIELGADVVLHSVTKAMAGHSDILGGASIFSKKFSRSVREALRTFGGSMDPFAAFLLDRGLKTLPVRARQVNATTRILVSRCAEHPKIKKVNYPGLKSHPQHAIAAAQMRGFGGMFSFDLAGYEDAKLFANRIHLMLHAASFGGVESLVTLPILSSHYGQPEKNLRAAGISPGTVRVSVGLEDAEDLWADIQQALGG